MIERTFKIHPFQCSYCHRTFAREQTWEKHYCKKMERNDKFQSPIGQTAWYYYQKWMQYKRRAVHRKDTFVSSRYFNTFFLFVKHAKKLNFPDVDIFIRLMVQCDYPPVMWCSDDVYGEYLTFLDQTTSPMRQLLITLRTLDEISVKNNINVSDVLRTLSSTEIIALLRQRKLSPWVLLRSVVFRDFFEKRITTTEREIVKSIIRFHDWKNKFETHKDELKTIDQMVSDLQL